MRDRLLVLLLVFVAAMFSPPGFARGSQAAQDSPAPAQRNNSRQDQGNTFPLAQSEAAAKRARAGGGPHAESRVQGSSAAGEADKQSSPTDAKHPAKASPAEDNPFPEAQSRAAAKGSGHDEPAPQSSSSETSGKGYSSSDAHLPPPDVGRADAGRREKEDTYSEDQTSQGRVKNDLDVADLYMKNGNYRGAFLRYQDILKYDPQNDTALFGSAMAMCKQNLTGDALTRMKSYVRDHPEGKYARKAAGILARPGKCSGNP